MKGPENMRKWNIGVNLYGLGKKGGAGFEDIVPTLSEYGFGSVEPLVLLACDSDLAAADPHFPPAIWPQEALLSRSLALKEQYGMSIHSCHLGCPPWEDFSGKTRDMIQILQSTDVRCFVVSRMLSSVEACKRDSEIFARTAEAIRPYGGVLCYHNHERELRRDMFLGREQTLLDIFLTLCPDVMLEPDLGWVRYAGEDEVAFLHEHRQRIALLHLKDFKRGFSAARREADNVAIGDGVLRLPEILSLSRELGLADALIIDQDHSAGDMLDDLKRGIENLNAVFNTQEGSV